MDKKKALQLRLNGQTYGEIANQLGVSRQRIQQSLSPPTAVRKFIFKQFHGQCNSCGILVGSSGHIHHKSLNDVEDYGDIENLELLCPSCHRQKHTGNINHHCLRCGHQWTGQEHPVTCPKCRSAYWNIPRKKRK